MIASHFLIDFLKLDLGISIGKPIYVQTYCLLQTDSLIPTKWLNTNMEYPIEFSNLVLDCKWLLNKEWEACVEHMWREANNCANMLASRGASQLEREILYNICPTFL